MNIYSLDYFEQTLPVDKIRPPYQKPQADGPRLAVCDVKQAGWDGTVPVPSQEHISLLSPHPAAGSDRAETDHFLQRLGMHTGGGRGFAGVLLDPDCMDPAPISAWRRAFDAAPLIVRADRPQQIAALRREGIPFGLLLDASGGTRPVRRQLATQDLQCVWQSSPVFLLAKGCPDEAEALSRALESWHVLAADVPGALPGALLVRRVTYPKALSSGGAFPVRLWLQNVGGTPVYPVSRLQLMLRGAAECREIPLRMAAQAWPVGDTVYNEIAQLPGLAPGDYQLLCRVWRMDGCGAVPLGEEAETDGWYPLGKLTLDDTPRPELYTVWDNYYPDGYYPLVDPPLPK